MKCLNHSNAEAAGICGCCQNHFCEECLVKLGTASYCKSCVEKSITGKGVKEESGVSGVSPIKTGQRKSRFWAFLFSGIPGAGYMYLGLMNRGLQTMIIFFGAIFVAAFIDFGQIMALVAPVVVFYSIFDTQQAVQAINYGIPVEDKTLFDIKQISFDQRWFGYALIILGSLAVLNNVMPHFSFWPEIRRMLAPLLIIGLGAVILYRSTRKEIQKVPEHRSIPEKEE